MRHLRLLTLAVFSLIGGVTAFAQEDITIQYLKNADLKSLDGWDYGDNGYNYSGWTTDGDVPVIDFYNAWSSNAGAAIGNTINFHFTQTITLPAGNYRLAVNGYYREGLGNGTNTKAYIFAGANTQYLVGVNSGSLNSYTGSSDVYKAANAFSKGDFLNTVDFNLENSQQITLGLRGYIDTYCSWCLLGPMKLYRISNNETSDIPAYYSNEINDDTDYWLYNAATGKYLGGGNDWGVRSSLIDHGIPFKFIKQSGSVYHLDSYTSNGGENHYLGGEWIDWNATDITAIPNSNGTFSLKIGDHYLKANINNTEVDLVGNDASDSFAQWYLLSKVDLENALYDATKECPADATFYIKDFNFSRNNVMFSEWEWTFADQNNNHHNNSGNTNNYCVESLHAAFNQSQEMVLPNGTYKLTAQGFYRNDDGITPPVFFANNEELTFPERMGSENNMQDASASFSAGLYKTKPIEVTVTDHILKIGAKCDNDGFWCVWDNFELECISAIKEAAKEPYALLSTDGTSLTFYYDNQKASRQGTVYALNEGDNTPDWIDPIWGRRSIKSVSFDSSFANARPKTCCKWFFNLTGLTSIIGISYLNTSNVTNMERMFYGCSGLTSLDVSNFNTSEVTNMSGMFYECEILNSLDLSNFDTSKVIDMNMMFQRCSSLNSLDLSKFDTSNVTNMSGMFNLCYVTNLDLSNFDTSKVTDMSFMFSGCNALESLNISNFDTSKVTDMSYMFLSCFKLKCLDVSHFDTSKVTDMSCVFTGCKLLNSLDISNFDTSKVVNMQEIFSGCSSLTSLDISNFDMSKVSISINMLYGCSHLENLSIPLPMSNLDNTVCTYVGTSSSPCLLIVPEGFDFGEGVNPSGDSFQWKSGWFTLFDYPEVDEEDPFQKYLDELTEQQEMREEYADPEEELDPFQKYIDLLDNDITLTSPKTMVPGTVLTIANGGFSADAWNGGAHVFDIPEGSGLVLNDITVDFSSEANYGTGSQLGLFDVSGDLTLGEKTVIKGWLDTASGASNAPHASATDDTAKNRLATGSRVSGAVVSLQSGSTLCIDGARMDNVALLLNADETNVKAMAPLQGELNVVVPESAMTEGYKLMVGEGYTFTLADAISVNIVNGGGEWDAEVAKDGSLSLFPLSILGDVNGDGQVTITDVAAVVDYILGNTTGYFRETAANVVRDKGITISDVTTIVEMILGN